MPLRMTQPSQARHVGRAAQVRRLNIRARDVFFGAGRCCCFNPGRASSSAGLQVQFPCLPERSQVQHLPFAAGCPLSVVRPRPPACRSAWQFCPAAAPGLIALLISGAKRGYWGGVPLAAGGQADLSLWPVRKLRIVFFIDAPPPIRITWQEFWSRHLAKGLDKRPSLKACFFLRMTSRAGAQVIPARSALNHALRCS